MQINISGKRHAGMRRNGARKKFSKTELKCYGIETTSILYYVDFRLWWALF
jgi:hypothetical protein